MYVLADYEAQPAIVFLRGVGRARKWPAKNTLELKRMIEDLLLGADLELLMRWTIFYANPLVYMMFTSVYLLIGTFFL